MRPPEYRRIDRFVYLHVYYKERARYLDGPSKFDPLRQVLVLPSAAGRLARFWRPTRIECGARFCASWSYQNLGAARPHGAARAPSCEHGRCARYSRRAR